jgi:hypothetical protein
MEEANNESFNQQNFGGPLEFENEVTEKSFQ